MAEPVRLLVFSKDGTLFERGADIQGDARLRHLRYAERLRELYGPGCEVRVITYTTKVSGNRQDDPAPGLRLYGTASAHRALYLFDAIRLIGPATAGSWRPTAVTAQTPWEEGVVAALLAKVMRADFLPQLHFDLMSDAWAREHPLNLWRRLVASMVFRSATRIRVVSRLLKERIVSGLGLDERRVDIIPVGVNFTPSSLSQLEAKASLGPELAQNPLVLFVGRLTFAKNLRLWLDVASDVLEARPDVRFAIVGDGEDEADLRRIIETRGQANEIRMLGAVGHERLPDVYAAADLFLLTSHYEGFGRVVLEAACAGVPTVSTRSAGPEDLIENGQTGLLVDLDDRAGLANAVLELIGDPQRALEMGNAARRKSDADFGLTSLATKLSHHWAGE